MVGNVGESVIDASGSTPVFRSVVEKELYRFSFLNNATVLVSTRKAEYILYKSKTWKCADELSSDLIEELGDIIDEHLRVPQR